MKLSITTLWASIMAALVATACGNPGKAKTEPVEGVDWYVTVNKVVEFHDSVSGIGTDGRYTVADTSRVNVILRKLPKCGDINIDWTLPSADGQIWLVAYDTAPLLSEKVPVTEVNTLPSYEGNVQVAFRFPDAVKWAEITRDNICKRLALTVNGRLMNAPQVNTEITSGNCSVSVPGDMVGDLLPGIKLDI